MNPWLIAIGIVGGGFILAAATARASDKECEITDEWVSPYQIAAVMIRECILVGPDGQESASYLWDIAHLDDVEIGPDFKAAQWPDESLFYGSAKDPDEAMDDAMAWIDANVAFIEIGERGPLAVRVEDFLAKLSPSEFDALREIFRFQGTAVSDAWPYVTALRTAPTDEDFMEIGRQLGNKLGALTDEERSALQGDILSAVGWGNGLTLKGILDDAGVM